MMSSFHDRMPAIIDKENCSVWLDTDVEDHELLKSLLQPRAKDDLLKHRVSNHVNNWRNEGADCVQPLK